MISIKKIGAAVAIAVLTSFSAVSANAAILTFLPGDAIPSPNFDDVLFFKNGTSDLVVGGDLQAGQGFDADESTTPNGSADGLGNTFEFTVDASINPPGIQLPVSYAFSVTTENGGSVGIANLTFTVFRNNVQNNQFIVTNGSGLLQVGATFFSPTWNHNDVIRWEVSGTVLSQGGSYEAQVSAVPLPASVLMLVGALAGFGFIGRMKKTRFAAA